MVLVSAMLLGSLAGCDDSKWKESAKAALPATFEEESIGKIYCEGEVMSFPLKVQDMLDGAFKYPTNIKDIEDETLDSNWSTGALEMVSKKSSKHTVEIKALNIEQETLNLKECRVENMTFKKESGNVMLPGGIEMGQKFDSKDAFESAIPAAFKSSDGSNYVAEYESPEHYICKMTLTVKDASGKVALDSVKFETEYYYEAGYFLDVEMKAAVKKDYTDYGKLFDDEPDVFAKDWRSSAFVNILYLYGFSPDSVTEDQYAKMDVYFDKIMKDVEWKFESSEDSVSVTFKYPDISTVLEDAFNKALEEYTKTDVTVDDMKVDQDLINAFIDHICAQDVGVKLVSDATFKFEKLDGESISTDDFSDLLYSLFGLYEPIQELRGES